jgi:hypothetical protein
MLTIEASYWFQARVIDPSPASGGPTIWSFPIRIEHALNVMVQCPHDADPREPRAAAIEICRGGKLATCGAYSQDRTYLGFDPAKGTPGMRRGSRSGVRPLLVVRVAIPTVPRGAC